MSAALPPVHFNSPPLAMPLAVPAGNQTWEVRTRFPTDRYETEAMIWTIKRPCLITSFRPSVVLVGDPLTFQIPNIEEYLEVALVADSDWLLTTETNQDGGTPIEGNFVTLASIGPQSRLWNLRCTAPTPRLSAQFRTKIGTAAPATSGMPVPLIVSITAIGWYLDHRGNPITGRSE